MVQTNIEKLKPNFLKFYFICKNCCSWCPSIRRDPNPQWVSNYWQIQACQKKYCVISPQQNIWGLVQHCLQNRNNLLFSLYSVQQNNLLIFIKVQWEAGKTQNGGYSGQREGGSFFIILFAGSQPVANVAWLNAHRAFAVEAFFCYKDLVVAALCSSTIRPQCL